MALDGTRAGLKETAKNWLIRPADTLVDSFMDDWIKLCELRFNREQFLRAMVVVASGVSLASASSTPGRLALPSNFKELRSITVTSTSPDRRCTSRCRRRCIRRSARRRR